MAPESTQRIAAILNACWWVRHYARGGRMAGRPRELRAEAIQALGLICREAFSTSDDFEPLLRAIVDGLVPHDAPRF